MQSSITIWSMIIIGWIISNISFAQSNTKVDNLIPPSPDAAALDKYVQIPVGHYTGVPKISIPLFDLTEGDITVPISLSYHASGNKVDEIASWVGMGWALNAGGTITRTVVGEADESPTGFLNTTYTYSTTEIVNGKPNVPKYTLWRDLVECADAEPDRFSFNFNGYTGMFGFEWNTDNNFDILSSDISMKIEPLDGAGNPWQNGQYTTPIAGFRVTTSDGTVYLFKDYESTYHRLIGVEYGNTEYCRVGEGTDGLPPVPVVSAWHLSKIISPNGFEVNFGYSGYNLDYQLIESEMELHRYGCWNTSGYKQQKGRFLIVGKYLSSISSQSGNTKIEFIASQNPRTDLPLRNDNTANNLYGLGGVRISKRVDGVYRITKDFTLSYNYEIGRLTLKELKELPLDGVSEVKPPFEFTYNTNVTLPPFIGKLISSNQQDHWGYLNGNTYHKLIPTYISNACGNEIRVFPGANRSPSADSIKAGILTRIKYPTGGSTNFEYEPHFYGAVGSQNLVSAKMAGGVRITKIEVKDEISPANDYVKVFKYEMADGMSSGVIATEPVYTSDYETYNGNEAQSFIAVSATSSIPLGMTQGNHIGYRRVTELNGLNGIGGKSEFYFTSFFDHNDDYTNSSEQPFPPPKVYDYQRGLLTKCIDYKFENNNFLISKQTVNQYDFINFELTGFKVSEQYPGSKQAGINLYREAFYTYALGVSSPKPIHTTETLYEGGEGYVIESERLYDENLQFLRKETIKNDDKAIISEYTYPFDYTSYPYTEMKNRHILSPAIESVVKLREANGVEKVIDASYTQYNITPNNRIAPLQQFQLAVEKPVIDFHHSKDFDGDFDARYYTSIMRYNRYSSFNKPEQITTPGDVVTSYIWGYDGSMPIAQIVNGAFDRCAFTNFESTGKGNWNYAETGVQVANSISGDHCFSGMLTSSVLSPGKYVVSVYAKWKGNGTVQAITINGTPQSLNNSWQRYQWIVTNPGTITVNTNGNSVDDLRLHPVEAQMKTFAYDAIQGFSSITDENHQTIYYEYDSYGRLKNVKDGDKNIRTNYRYHYKN